MKKIIPFILFLFLFGLSIGQTTYYVKTYASGGRDEAGKDGLSVANAWASISYAAGRVPAGNNEIYIESGTYTDNNRAVLALGVNLRGNSTTRPIINVGYVAQSPDDGYLRMYSSSGNAVDGSHEISYINFDGNLIGTRGAIANYRSNVVFHHCNFTDFLYYAIWFNGCGNWNTRPTNILPVGNKVYNCNFTDCTQLTNNAGYIGHVRTMGQNGAEIYNCTFDQRGRSGNDNTDILTGYQNRGTKIHHNTFYKNDLNGTEFNFFAEFHYSNGGFEVYSNSFNGAACWDASGNEDLYGYGFGLKWHDNTCQTNAIPLMDNPGSIYGSHNQAYLCLETFTVNDDCYIYNNYFKNSRMGIQYNNAQISSDNVWIYNNVFEQVGNTYHNYNSAIKLEVGWGDEGETDWSNIHILNNTIYSNTVTSMCGIHVYVTGDITNIEVRNNIIVGNFYAAGIRFEGNSGHTPTVTNANITNNITYVSGTNAIVYDGAPITYNNRNEAANKINTNPQLIGGSPYNFNISSTGSPAYHAGYPVGLETDYNDIPYASPPSIGAYEYAPVYANVFYVAAPPLGSNTTGTGSTDAPWATLSYAASQVHLAGSIIYLMTNIIDNSRVNLDARVSVAGMGTKTITTSYVATSSSDAYLRLYSSTSVPANGSQSISYIRFNGNNLTATRAIWVGYRSNVEIHHCTIENFYDIGIHFRNEVGWTTPPTVYATGNSVHDNNFINCSAMHGNQPAQLRLDGQSGLLIYNNTFDQRQRPLGQNGANVRWSNVQKIKMYNNTFYKNPVEVVADGTYDWPFFCELWHNKGNSEIYNNTFYGQHTIDVGGFQNEIIGDNTFGYKIYGNRFLNNTRIDPVQVHPNDYSLPWAITLEGNKLEYIYVYNNHFQRYGYGVEIATGSSTSTGIPALNFLHDHIYIYNNIFEDMGFLTYPYSAAVVVINEVNDPGYTNTSTNWWIVNNVMTGGNRAQNGFRATFIGTVDNINVKNNIIYDFTSNPIYITKRTTDVTSFRNSSITYNDFYSNGSDAIYINSGISQSGNSITTGNITSNPLFMNIGTGNFRLQSTSPCLSKGTVIGDPVIRDYMGNYWGNPPSMGVYEMVGESIPSVTTTPVSLILNTTAVSGGMVISDGGRSVTARGVCWGTSSLPTTSNSFTSDGEGTGLFTSTLTGLTASTTYYVRAYAINSLGTSYGEERVFTTQPGGGVVIGDLSKQDGEFVKHLDELIYVE